MKLDLYLKLLVKIDLKLIKDLIVKPETMKLMREKIEKARWEKCSWK